MAFRSASLQKLCDSTSLGVVAGSLQADWIMVEWPNMTQRQTPYRATRKRQPTMHDLTLEKSLQEALEQAFRLHGWLYYHSYDSRMDRPGFPDIMAIHPATLKMIVWELKAEGKKAEGEQLDWLDAFKLFAQDNERLEVDVVRPSDQDLALKLIERWARP